MTIIVVVGIIAIAAKTIVITWIIVFSTLKGRGERERNGDEGVSS
jgi:hypothetical protein